MDMDTIMESINRSQRLECVTKLEFIYRVAHRNVWTLQYSDEELRRLHFAFLDRLDKVDDDHRDVIEAWWPMDELPLPDAEPWMVYSYFYTKEAPT